jgi:hypothetical protein
MKQAERRLLDLFRTLDQAQRETLLDFSEFLASRRPAAEPVPREPLDIPRPDQESVVKAIRRLMATYPMLEKDRLFHETAHHMTQHVVQGKAAGEVIDELEITFRQHYQNYVNNRGEAPER